MTKTIQVKKDEESGEFYIDTDQLADLFEDVNIVDSYKFESLEDGSFSLQFFDKDNNVVYPIKKE